MDSTLLKRWHYCTFLTVHKYVFEYVDESILKTMYTFSQWNYINKNINIACMNKNYDRH